MLTDGAAGMETGICGFAGALAAGCWCAAGGGVAVGEATAAGAAGCDG